jgi:hypothetical protein
VDISLAALLGEDVYNFGELLLHPIVSCIHFLWHVCKAACACAGSVAVSGHRTL